MAAATEGAIRGFELGVGAGLTGHGGVEVGTNEGAMGDIEVGRVV